MRIVFMGSSEFSCAILNALCEKHEIVAVYTAPDAIRSRGNKTQSTPVGVLAAKLGVPSLNPATLKGVEALATFSSFNADVACVAAYGLLIPKAMLSIPFFGFMNVHASLLPRWRGAAPIERAILAGDTHCGISIMKMQEGLDTGPFSIQRSVDISSKSYAQLSGELALLGADALLECLHIAQTQELRWIPQNDANACYAAKLKKDELHINPRMDRVTASRYVRASGDAHPSKCIIAGRIVRILEFSSYEKERLPLDSLNGGAAALIGNRLMLGFADGAIEVLRLKPDGKKEMDALAFARGIQGIKSGNIVWSGLNS